MAFTVSQVLQSPIWLVGFWAASGLVAILAPLLHWNRKRQAYYSYYGRYNEYQQNQRAYEEAQNGNYNNNNNNNNYNQPNMDCGWWQFQCRKQRYQYMQYMRDNKDDQIYTPNWYQLIGGKMEEDDRMREEMGLSASQASGAMKFVYLWTLFIFLAILAYGAVVIYKNQPSHTLVVTLLVVGQLTLLQMILMGQGVISTEGRDMEDSVYGWYGQMGVLCVYANFAYTLFLLVFALLFGIKALWVRRETIGSHRVFAKFRRSGPEKQGRAADTGDYKAAENMNMA